MEKSALSIYDPFPLFLGEERVLGDFTFKFLQSKTKYYYGHGEYYLIQAQIVDSVSNKKITLNFGNVYKNNTAYIVKFISIKRKALTLNGIKIFCPLALKRQKSVSIGSAYSRWNKDFKNVNLDASEQEIMDRLLSVISNDRKSWLKERRNNKKSGITIEDPIKDLLKTNDLMKLTPLIRNLQHELNSFADKDDYTKKDVLELEKTFNKIKHYSYFWTILKKHSSK